MSFIRSIPPCFYSQHNSIIVQRCNTDVCLQRNPDRLHCSRFGWLAMSGGQTVHVTRAILLRQRLPCEALDVPDKTRHTTLLLPVSWAQPTGYVTQHHAPHFSMPPLPLLATGKVGQTDWDTWVVGQTGLECPG